MNTFTIKITEIMEREIYINAPSELEAISDAMKKYQDRKFMLFPGIHVSTDFNIVDNECIEEEIAV